MGIREIRKTGVLASHDANLDGGFQSSGNEFPDLAFAYDFVRCQRHRSHPQKDSGHLVKCYFVSHKKSVDVPHRQAVTSQSAFSNGQNLRAPPPPTISAAEKKDGEEWLGIVWRVPDFGICDASFSGDTRVKGMDFTYDQFC